MGKSVVVHCRMGIGRSSILAGCLVMQEGYKVDDVFDHISKVRGLKVPDTDEQQTWVKKISPALKK